MRRPSGSCARPAATWPSTARSASAYSLLDICRDARSGHRSHAAAGRRDRRRRGDPVLRSAAAARADGPALRFRQGRGAADRAADRTASRHRSAASCSSRARRSAHVLDADPSDSARARRPRSAHRLCRRAVHAGVVRDRGRPLEQLRQDQGADVRPSRRLASALRETVAAWSPTISSRRSRRASMRCRCSTRGSARSNQPTTASSRCPTRSASSTRSAQRVPTIHFGTGTATILEDLRDAGGDVIGVDWRIPIDDAWDAHRPRSRGSGQSRSDAAARPARAHAPADGRRSCGASAAGPGHIFNLGHGILPSTPVEHVQMLAQYVHAHGAAPTTARRCRRRDSVSTSRSSAAESRASSAAYELQRARLLACACSRPVARLAA